MLRLRNLTRDRACLHEGLREIVTSDLVIDRGGPFFAANNRVVNLSLYSFAHPLLVARKFGVPFGFAPGSTGPFASNWSKRFVQKLFGEANFIMVRDDTSKAQLAACGVRPEEISVTLDSAFWVEPNLSARVEQAMAAHGLEPGEFLAVTTRSWYAEQQQRYHRELAETIDALVPTYFRKVVLVSNMVDPTGSMHDDMPATVELYKLIQNKKYVSILGEDFGPHELVGFYGQAKLVLGTRLHSVIMALAAGTPVVAVSYVDHKTHGVMQLVDLHRYTMDLDSFSKEEAISLVLSALTMRDEIGGRIRGLRAKGDTIFGALMNQ
jgi:polysaccharide pyruvyl transferase WcaK-like protein